jgi:hypothetical protein
VPAADRRAFVDVPAENQPLLRDPLVWSQAWLIVMVALGFADFDVVLFAYYAEIVAVLLVSLLAFTRSWRMLLRRVLELLVKSVFLGFLMLIVISLFRGRKDQHAIDLGTVWGPMAVSAAYCTLTLLPVLWRAYRTDNPAREWVRKAVSPLMSIVGVILIALFAGQLAFGLAGNESVAAHRVLATVLMAISGVTRVLFARLFESKSIRVLDADYAVFMNSKTLG